MNRKILSHRSIVLASFFILFNVAAPVRPVSAQQTHDKGVGYDKYACGPQALKSVLERLGKPQSSEALVAASGTNGFKTTLEGMRRALDDRGVTARYYRADIGDLTALAAGRYLICHTKRNHFLVITRAEASWIYMVDTYLGPREIRVPPEVFFHLWDGVVLAVESGQTVRPVRLAAISRDEAEKIVGAQSDCENALNENKPRRNKNSKANTKEPVDTATGNYFTSKTDLAIPGMGIPLILERTYNAQTVSTIDGWTPEVGAGSWVIEDGEMSGEGDRIHCNGVWSDGTITVDMQTVTPGENYTYEAGQINFRFKGEKDRYYVLLNTDGRLELTKFKAGVQSFLANAATPLNPLKWNKFQIQTSTEGSALRIRVTVNDLPYIDYLDKAPLGPGEMVLESYFCHAHYDNISISDKSNFAAYKFDWEDNDYIFGYGWTTFLDCSLRVIAGGNVLVIREDGEPDVYTRLADGSYTPPKGVYDKLSKDASGYTLQLVKKNLFYRFDTTGRLLSVKDRNNNTIQLKYSTVQAQ